MAAPTTITEDVWHALGDELRGFLRSRLPCESDADDVLQNVFVRVAEKIDSLRETDRIASWVYSIARNEIADFYRRRTPRPVETVEEAVCAADDATTANQSVGAWLTSMIAGLPVTLRDALRLYEIEGMTQADIAARLHISVSGAKSRIQRGRRYLEKKLRDCCQVDLDRRGNVIECQPASTSCAGESPCACCD